MSGSHLRYVIKLLFLEVVAAGSIGALLSFYLQQHLTGLNYAALFQALVALNSGIIIAMFVALFHSSNKNIENFKKFNRAARQVYLIFLINSALVCFLSVFVQNYTRDPQFVLLPNQMVFNIVASLFALIVSGKNVQLIYRLLQVNFR